MFKLYFSLFLTFFLLILAEQMASARVIETKKTEVTPHAVVTTTNVIGVGSDSLAIGDPYGNRALGKRAQEGPAITQQPYSNNCQEARCLRAKKRQLSSYRWP